MATKKFTIPTSPETAQVVYENRNSYGNDRRSVRCIEVVKQSDDHSVMVFEADESVKQIDFFSDLFFTGLFAGMETQKL